MRYLSYLLLFFLFIPNYTIAKETKTLPTLVIYSNASFARDWMQIGHPIKRAFEFQCNCKLEFITLTGNTMFSRLLLEGNSSRADLVVGLDMNLIDKAEESGLFAPHNISVKGLSIPMEWTNKYFIPYNYGYIAFIYNSKKLKNPPKSFQELIDRPDDELKFIMQDPRSSTVGRSLVFWTKLIYGDQAQEIWRKLKNKIVTVTKSFSESYVLFTEGEADMLISYSSSPAYHMIAEGNYDIKAAEFAEGHYLQIELAGKLKSSKQQELADRFLEFILSRSFQRSIPINAFMFPVIDLGSDLPKEYSHLFTPKRIFIAQPEDIKKNRNLWIQEWLKALSKR